MSHSVLIPVAEDNATARLIPFGDGVSFSVQEQQPQQNQEKTDMFASMVTGSLESRVMELKGALNEATVTIADLRRQLQASEGRGKMLTFSVKALKTARDSAEQEAFESKAEIERLQYVLDEEKKKQNQQQQPFVSLPDGNQARVHELEKQLKSLDARHSLLLNAVKRRAEDAERRLEQAESRLENQSSVVDIVAADEIATNDELLRVIARCIDALRPVMVEEEIALMERSPADRNAMLPAAIVMLGKLWETTDEQRLDARAQCEEARVLLAQSESACDQLQAQIDTQAATIEKLKEIVSRGAAQHEVLLTDNAKMAEALCELAPLAEHCRVMTDENARLKALHAETKEMMVTSAVNVAAREEIVRKRMEALDNVPTEKLYIEYLERKTGVDKKKVALLLSTLVSKVRLLTSEVVQLRERNMGLMQVILEDARQDKERGADVEYLSTCLAWKDAMDERVRWDGQFHHEMEERALLAVGRGGAESEILAAAGHSNGLKQKVVADSGPSSVREEFNKTTKRAAAAKAAADRFKAISNLERHRADAALKELAAVKLENVRLSNLLAMPALERQDILRIASAPDAVKCAHCVDLLRVNQDLASYRRMEDARHADAANRLKELAKDGDAKLAELKQAHRAELQEAAARYRESANMASSAAASMKKQIAELEARIEVEKKRTDARIARNAPVEDPPYRHEIVQPVAAAAAAAAPIVAEERMCKHVARQVALSVLHQTWRSMQHTPEEGARLSVLLRDDAAVERALETRMAGRRDQTLGDYVIQVVKQCISANNAFSKQVEKEKSDTTLLLYELVNDSKTVIANVLSKVAPSNLPDVAALRRLIEESENSEAFGQEQRRAILSTAFDTCAKYIESIVEWIEAEKHQTPPPQQQQQQQQHQQQPQPEDFEDGDSGKRLARGSLGHDRKKMHKSAGEYDRTP